MPQIHAQSPDLIVESVSWTPAAPVVGSNITFSAIIRNTGTAATPAGPQNRVTWSIGAQSFWAETTASLPVGGTATLTATAGTPAATWTGVLGENPLTTTVDSLNNLSETDEANNAAGSKIKVAATAFLSQLDDQTLDILMVGNSYTAGMFDELKKLLDAAKIMNRVETYTVNGAYLDNHVSDFGVQEKLTSRTWDIVVLQDESQTPSIIGASPVFKDKPEFDTYWLCLAAYNMTRKAYASNPNARLVWFATPAYKNTPSMNVGTSYTYNRWRNTYSNPNSQVAETGNAFLLSYAAQPALNLHDADLSHHSAAGQYLIACVMFDTIVKKSCVGLADTANVGTNRTYLQTKATEATLAPSQTWGSGLWSYDKTTETVQPTTADVPPDLSVQSVSWSPASPLPGDAVTFSAVIKNNGIVASPSGAAYPNRIIWTLPNGQIFWKTITTAIAAGGTTTVTADSGSAGSSWTATAGVTAITATVDAHANITELYENNNTLTGYVNGLPDLIVESVFWSPKNPVSGSKITFGAVIKNIGGKATTAGSANYNVVTWGVPGASFWTGTSDSIPAGGRLLLTATSGSLGTNLWSPVTPTTHTVTATVDAQSKNTEQNETNNTRTAPITIAAAPNSTADSDNDGMSNLLEQALGGNPAVSDAATTQPTVHLGTNSLNISFTRADSNFTYRVRSSTDLTDWSKVEYTIIPFEASSVPYLLRVPMSGTKKFIRLEVIR
jgi:hypothetical protein